jgi:hypothetical protein
VKLQEDLGGSIIKIIGFIECESSQRDGLRLIWNATSRLSVVTQTFAMKKSIYVTSQDKQRLHDLLAESWCLTG